ncbi:unnamed protein product [Rhodiola kirilowii]
MYICCQSSFLRPDLDHLEPETEMDEKDQRKKQLVLNCPFSGLSRTTTIRAWSWSNFQNIQLPEMGPS